MKWLLWVFLLAALMVFLYRYVRKNKPTKLPRKYHLPGFAFPKGPPWKSSSMTKGTGENQSEVVGESHDQDALEEIFRPRTDEDEENADNATIGVEEDNL